MKTGAVLRTDVELGGQALPGPLFPAVPLAVGHVVVQRLHGGLPLQKAHVRAAQAVPARAALAGEGVLQVRDAVGQLGDPPLQAGCIAGKLGAPQHVQIGIAPVGCGGEDQIGPALGGVFGDAALPVGLPAAGDGHLGHVGREQAVFQPPQLHVCAGQQVGIPGLQLQAGDFAGGDDHPRLGFKGGGVLVHKDLGGGHHGGLLHRLGLRGGHLRQSGAGGGRRLAGRGAGSQKQGHDGPDDQ